MVHSQVRNACGEGVNAVEGPPLKLKSRSSRKKYLRKKSDEELEDLLSKSEDAIRDYAKDIHRMKHKKKEWAELRRALQKERTRRIAAEERKLQHVLVRQDLLVIYGGYSQELYRQVAAKMGKRWEDLSSALRREVATGDSWKGREHQKLLGKLKEVGLTKADWHPLWAISDRRNRECHETKRRAGLVSINKQHLSHQQLLQTKEVRDNFTPEEIGALMNVLRASPALF